MVKVNIVNENRQLLAVGLWGRWHEKLQEGPLTDHVSTIPSSARSLTLTNTHAGFAHSCLNQALGPLPKVLAAAVASSPGSTPSRQAWLRGCHD